MQLPTPEPQHQWLQQLVGDWTYEHQGTMDPEKPDAKLTGTEQVRAIGDLWITAEGQGEMPGGGTATFLLTIGYDPKKQRFVGTWLGSMMTDLWVYEGTLEGDTLTLETEGPAMTPEGGTARYRETIELKNLDYRTFSSSVLGPDGNWTTFMTADYRRVSGR